MSTVESLPPSVDVNEEFAGIIGVSYSLDMAGPSDATEAPVPRGFSMSTIALGPSVELAPETSLFTGENLDGPETYAAELGAPSQSLRPLGIGDVADRVASPVTFEATDSRGNTLPPIPEEIYVA